MTSSAVQVGTSPTRLPSKGENEPWLGRSGAAVTSVVSRSIGARSSGPDAGVGVSTILVTALLLVLVLGPSPCAIVTFTCPIRHTHDGSGRIEVARSPTLGSPSDRPLERPRTAPSCRPGGSSRLRIQLVGGG